MTDLSEIKKLASYRPKHKVRFVTAASLFDGHDASINIMRRILQSMGAEVIHLGHNRSVEEIVTAALQEDVQGIAVSSYQGGHVEFFKYMLDLLRQRGGEGIRVYGGGAASSSRRKSGNCTTMASRASSRRKTGRRWTAGNDRADGRRVRPRPRAGGARLARRHHDKDLTKRWRALARMISALELNVADAKLVEALHKAADTAKVPVLGVTGTGRREKFVDG